MQRLSFHLPLLLCLFLPVDAANGGIFVVTFSSQTYSIDNDTLVGTSLGFSSPGFLNSLARDNFGTVYSANSFLFTMNTSTGSGTLGAAVNIGDETDIRGMAFAPDDNTMFAVEDGGFGGFASDALFTINTTNGNAVQKGLTGFQGIQSLEFSSTGTLYAWDLTEGLLTINPNTGVATDVNPGLGSTAGFQTLAFDAAQNLFGATSDSIYHIDTSTGAATLLGGSNFSGVRGMVITGEIPVPDPPATVPEPTSLALLTSGAFGFMCYGCRRKRKLAL